MTSSGTMNSAGTAGNTITPLGWSQMTKEQKLERLQYARSIILLIEDHEQDPYCRGQLDVIYDLLRSIREFLTDEVQGTDDRSK